MATFGFLSSMPPTKCGLATFSNALAGVIGVQGDSVVGVRVVDSPPVETLADVNRAATHLTVVTTLVNGSPNGVRDAAATLNRTDVAVIQHEYGIYGGADGEDVVEVMRLLRVPTIVVIHTVLDTPTPHQKSVLEDVVRLASACVVMSDAALLRLREVFDVGRARVQMIPHGVAPPHPGSPDPAANPVVLTWGLIGPGKGIEWGIRSMAHLGDMHTPPTYRVVGETHPKVMAREGEAYRRELERITRTLGLDNVVEFHSDYLDLNTLGRYVSEASVVLLPYDSSSQITSGVLAEAVTAGIPVVATAFPHAIELLSTGAGIVVPHRDPAAMARSVRWVLTHPDEAQEMSRIGRQWGLDALWPAVGERFRKVARAIGASVAA